METTEYESHDVLPWQAKTMSHEVADRLLAECARIPDERLRAEVHRVIAAATENANEYAAEGDEDEDGDAGWEDAFMGTIENECTDADGEVKKWFDANL